MKMVEVDTILNAFNKIRANYDPLNKFEKSRHQMWSNAIGIINITAKSGLDIVQCKNCKHWCGHENVEYDQSEFEYYCDIHKAVFKGKDFCSYGERKDEQTDCETCKYDVSEDDYDLCEPMVEGECRYEPQTSGTPYKIDTSSVCKDESQTERSRRCAK